MTSLLLILHLLPSTMPRTRRMLSPPPHQHNQHRNGSAISQNGRSLFIHRSDDDDDGGDQTPSSRVSSRSQPVQQDSQSPTPSRDININTKQQHSPPTNQLRETGDGQLPSTRMPSRRPSDSPIKLRALPPRSPPWRDCKERVQVEAVLSSQCTIPSSEPQDLESLTNPTRGVYRPTR